jgi:TAT (twin-arginine translocation) pathway signal sequence
MRCDLNRREFVKIAAGAGAALAVPGSVHAALSSSKMIGIQVGAISRTPFGWKPRASLGSEGRLEDLASFYA